MATKHPCPDCLQCHWCSDSRCSVCLGKKGCGKHLSIAEQVKLYDRCNPDCRSNKPFTLPDAPPRKDRD